MASPMYSNLINTVYLSVIFLKLYFSKNKVYQKLCFHSIDSVSLDKQCFSLKKQCFSLEKNCLSAINSFYRIIIHWACHNVSCKRRRMQVQDVPVVFWLNNGVKPQSKLLKNQVIIVIARSQRNPS